MKKLFTLILINIAISHSCILFSMQISREILQEQQLSHLYLEQELVLVESDTNRNVRWISQILYQIHPKLRIGFSLPVFVKNKNLTTCKESVGIGDVLLESDFYFYQKKCKNEYRTLLSTFEIKIPTGSTKKEPLLGSGRTDFKFTIEGGRSSPSHFTYFVLGSTIKTEGKDFKSGNDIFFRTFAGPSFPRSKRHWRALFLVEFDGVFSKKNALCGIKQPKTNEKVLLLGPNIYIYKGNKSLFLRAVGPIYRKNSNFVFAFVLNSTITF